MAYKDQRENRIPITSVLWTDNLHLYGVIIESCFQKAMTLASTTLSQRADDVIGHTISIGVSSDVSSLIRSI